LTRLSKERFNRLKSTQDFLHPIGLDAQLLIGVGSNRLSGLNIDPLPVSANF